MGILLNLAFVTYLSHAVEVIHLGQAHPLDAHTMVTCKKSLAESIIDRSQFEIARYVHQLLDSEFVIFNEGHLREEFASEICMYPPARDFFPKGIPQSFNEWPESSKIYVRTFGIARALMCLGYTDQIRPAGLGNAAVTNVLGTFDARPFWQEFRKQYDVIGEPPCEVPVSKFRYAQLFELLHPDVYAVMFAEREAYAVNEIKTYIKANPQVSKVILIYGSTHNFAKMFTDNTEFKFQFINTDGSSQPVAEDAKAAAVDIN